jgi:hypothetical protein
MIKLKPLLKEIGEGTTPYKWSGPEESMSGGAIYYFTTEDGDYYKVRFDGTIDNAWELNFYVKNEGEYDSGTVTNKGRQFKIISTIMDIIKSFVEEYPADLITFTGSDKAGSTTNQRDLLYKRYIEKNIHQLPGWDTNVGMPGQSGHLSLFREEPLPGMELKST